MTTPAATDTRNTFLDFQKALDPSGTRILPAARCLDQINAPIQDGPISPSNADLGHRVVLDAALPTVYAGKINRGTPKSKGTTEQRNESMMMVTQRAETDVRLRDTMGETKYNAKRAQDMRRSLEALSQFVALQFYGGTIASNEATIDGLTTRMASLNAPAPGTMGSQVKSMGSVGGSDTASIFIVDWDIEQGAHWIYPQENKSGGLEAKHFENSNALDANSNPFTADVTEYTWYIGLAVENPNRIARLCNIDISDANISTSAGSAPTQGLIVDALTDIIDAMPSPLGVNRVIYTNYRLLSALRKQINSSKVVTALTREEYLGQFIPHFNGIPIRRLDQASLDESTVS